MLIRSRKEIRKSLDDKPRMEKLLMIAEISDKRSVKKAHKILKEAAWQEIRHQFSELIAPRKANKKHKAMLDFVNGNANFGEAIQKHLENGGTTKSAQEFLAKFRQGALDLQGEILDRTVTPKNAPNLKDWSKYAAFRHNWRNTSPLFLINSEFAIERLEKMKQGRHPRPKAKRVLLPRWQRAAIWAYRMRLRHLP